MKLQPGDVIQKEHFSTRPVLTIRAIDTHWGKRQRLIYWYEGGTWDFVHVVDPMIGTSIVKQT